MSYKKHLLDILAERIGCEYLSDLKISPYKEMAILELKGGYCKDFNADEIQEALSYISADEIIFERNEN